jgi:hypothetical protein
LQIQKDFCSKIKTFIKCFKKLSFFIMLRAMPATIAAGMLSEEGSEHNNKDVKKFMSNHARQFNRTARLSDTFHRAMDRSCPLMLAHLVDRKLAQRVRQPLPAEAIALLANPEALINEDNDDSGED